MRKIALIAFLAVFTAACSTSYRSDVTRFHKLPEPMGETVFITSSDPAKAGSLELAQYAGLLVPQLQSLGYKVVTDPKADLVIEIDYDVTESERRYYIYRGYSYYHYPFFSPYHFGFGHHRFAHHGFGHYGFGHYGFGYAFYPQEPRIRIIYTSRLVMKIRRANGELLFEGNASSNHYRDRLPKAMPYLVAAMFTNFPGQSGSTEVVRIERSDRG
ncbi:MAG: DUF4136 domain-containing protein [Proteobacteria bacterium]|nr:DUF4136 domain-containing protein [Pseudomonadota bacterium]